MAKSNLFTEQNQAQLAEQLFCANSSYSKLKQSTKQPALVFNDIVQLVTGNKVFNQEGKVADMMARINQSLTSRRIYQQLLQQFKFAESGLQAAASTGDALQSRSNDQFSLKFKRDNKYPMQVYVILTIAHPRQHHNNNMVALHLTNHDRAECVLFHPLIDGNSQLLMDDDHYLFKLLTDAQSRLYLL